MSFTQKERVELEELCALNRPVETSVMPRWQRKALQAHVSPAKPAASCKTPSKTPSKTGKATPKVPCRVPASP